MTPSNRTVAIAVMVALFLTGGVVGGVAVSLLDRDAPAARARLDGPRRSGEGPRGGPRGGRFPGARGFAPAGFVERLDESLGLTATQRDTVEAILERQRVAAEATLREMAPRLRAGVDSTHQEILRVLDAGQRERFEELVRRDRGVLGRPLPGARRGRGAPR